VLPDREWIERAIARHDRDGDGALSLQEFLEMRAQSTAAAVSCSPAPGRRAPVNSPAPGQQCQAPSAEVAATVEKAKLAFNAYDRNR
jgi:hypothetical protein